jgi:uracil-DNA glycosylase family 4
MSRRRSSSDRALALAALQERVRACRACQLAGYLAEARPIRDGGRASDRVMVIGQAPGARSDSYRRHFSGPAGTTLESWFTRAGFPPGYFRQRVYLTALTRCFPGKSPAGKGDRVPSAVELALCRPYLEQELAHVEPRLILLVGTLAIGVFLGKVKLVEVVGTIQHLGGRTLLPLPHSSPVSRWLNEPQNRGRVDRAIDLLAESRIKLRLI